MSFEVVLVLVAGVAAVSGPARRVGVPAPFALVVTHLVLPGLGLPAALALGAVVAPPVELGRS